MYEYMFIFLGLAGVGRTEENNLPKNRLVRLPRYKKLIIIEILPRAYPPIRHYHAYPNYTYSIANHRLTHTHTNTDTTKYAASMLTGIPPSCQPVSHCHTRLRLCIRGIVYIRAPVYGAQL